jgi:hypothetical protein
VRLTPNHMVDRLAVSSASPIRERWRDVMTALSPMWVGGAALLCLLLAFLAKPTLDTVSVRVAVWLQYLTLGTLFPAVVALVLLVERSGRALPKWLETFLIVIPILITPIFAGLQHSIIAVGLALVQTFACLLFGGWNSRTMPVSIDVKRQTPVSRTIEIARGFVGCNARHSVSLFAMSFVAWAVVLEMMTWWNFFTAPLVPPLRLLIIGAILLVACCWWAFAKSRPTRIPPTRVRWAVESVCLLVLIVLAFRTDGLFTTDRLGEAGSYFHWGVFIGPAEAVRQGAWLLWDVPSLYGFLSILSLAALPVSTSWQSLYLLNAIGSALLAAFLFFVIRNLHPGVRGSLFALIATAPVVFLVSNWPPGLTPPHYHPSAGAFRFGWCYVLVGLLLLERTVEPCSRRQRVVLFLGCTCWLLSVFWSAETAFYGTVIWIPAFAAIILRDHRGFHSDRNWKAIASWLLVPPALFAGALGAMALVYRRFLGHGPDVRAYVDAMLAFSGTFIADETGLFGGTALNRTIIVVLFGFLLLAMAASTISRAQGGLRDLPTALGLAFGMWGLASYAVGVTTPYAINRLIPYLVLGLGIVLAILVPHYSQQSGGSWIDLFKAGSIPILAGLLITAYTNIEELEYYASAIRNEGFHVSDVAVGLPQVDSTLSDLLQRAGVNAADPILYSGARYGDMMPLWTPAGETSPVVVSRQWMPAPPSVLVTVPDDRKQLYMERRADRWPQGGWLIERRLDGAIVEQAFDLDPWFFEQLDRSHTPTKIAQNDAWQLVWYEPIGNSDTARQSRLRSGRVPGMPSDLLVNGESLAGSILPPVWGYFGPEWTIPPVDRWRRCINEEGSLHLFTAEPLDAWVALDPLGGEFDGTALVAVNDAEAVAAQRSRGRDINDAERSRNSKEVLAPISLDPGWNRVSISVVAARQSEGDSADKANDSEPAGPSIAPLCLKTVDIRFE